MPSSLRTAPFWAVVDGFVCEHSVHNPLLTRSRGNLRRILAMAGRGLAPISATVCNKNPDIRKPGFAGGGNRPPKSLDPYAFLTNMMNREPQDRQEDAYNEHMKVEVRTITEQILKYRMQYAMKEAPLNDIQKVDVLKCGKLLLELLDAPGLKQESDILVVPKKPNIKALASPVDGEIIALKNLLFQFDRKGSAPDAEGSAPQWSSSSPSSGYPADEDLSELTD